jgi:ribosomal protein L40E
MTVWLMFWLIILIVVVITTSKRRKAIDGRRYDVKICPTCGTTQPGHAGYCRACGARV